MTSRTPGPYVSGCPDEARLLAYVDDALPSSERPALIAHLADCIECRTRVADWVRAVEPSEELELEPLPDHVMQRALDVVSQQDGPDQPDNPVPRPPAGLWKFAGAGLALAASLGLFLLRLSQNGNDSSAGRSSIVTGGPNPPEEVVMRGGEGKTFTTLFPKDQALLTLRSPAALVLEWSAYRGQEDPSSSADSAGGGVSYYVATVLGPSGHVVWSDRTRMTRISLPDSVRIVPGAIYTWSVAAQPTFGTSQETAPATFTVTR